MSDGGTAIGYDVTWSGRPADGEDPLQTFAMTVLAFAKQARSAGGDATVSRVRIAETDDADRPTRITAHLRIEAPNRESLESVDATIRRQARERADRDGTSVHLAPETEQQT